MCLPFMVVKVSARRICRREMGPSGHTGLWPWGVGAVALCGISENTGGGGGGGGLNLNPGARLSMLLPTHS